MERFKLIVTKRRVAVEMHPAGGDTVVLAVATEPGALHAVREYALPGAFEGTPKTGWLAHADGMRAALAVLIAAARWTELRPIGDAPRRAGTRLMCRLATLPAEVILYWFTGCFYGRMRYPFRCALTELLLQDGDDDRG